MDARRSIPGIDRLLNEPALRALDALAPRERIVAVLQEVQAQLRQQLGAGLPVPPEVSDPEWYAERVRAALDEWRRSSLGRVINATGTVLHTNLGRAPLPGAALRAIQETAVGYSNLEYDLERGERGSRYDHCVAQLRRLTGAEDALVVNNNAAAMVLALNTLALGAEAVISRGELVEIGGAFRVPDIMARSGAVMVEVGATNRTHLADYERAIGEPTAVLVKVHRSNFQQTGFVAEAALSELARLAHERDLPLLYDLGSGLLLDSPPAALTEEPLAAAAVAAGADLVAISGDKLLGGPQAGILLGRAALIDACRRNPLCRALRVDKLTIAALSATLALYADPAQARREVPALRMLALTAAELKAVAERLEAALRAAGVTAETAAGESRVGGGALPEAVLPTVLVSVAPRVGAAALERALRRGDPPVIARVQGDRVLLDPRTIQPDEEATLVQAVIAAWGA